MVDPCSQSSRARLATMCALYATTFAWFGCSEEEKPKEVLVDKPANAPASIVTPDSFTCAEFLGDEDISQALGAPVKATQGHFAPPNGVPQPCHYLVTTPPAPAANKKSPSKKPKPPDREESSVAPETWSYDLDCRRSAMSDGEKLLAQWAGAGGEALSIGKGAVDHLDSVLLFIDDNSPCYVRVAGPRRRGRTRLANLIADRLVLRNAPMTAAAARSLNKPGD